MGVRPSCWPLGGLVQAELQAIKSWCRSRVSVHLRFGLLRVGTGPEDTRLVEASCPLLHCQGTSQLPLLLSTPLYSWSTSHSRCTGPKTLCNACGVRHVRMQQKKKSGSGGGPGKGKGGNKGGGSNAAGPASGSAVGAAAVAAAEEKAAAAPAVEEQPATQTRAARKVRFCLFFFG